MLSNTIWPRAWHEGFFRRDGVLDLIDGAVYTSEIPWTKPSPQRLQAAMDGGRRAPNPSRCVYVGDRLFDDVWGAQQAGMRAIHVPHSTIPEDQRGHTDGTPDAVAQRLAEIPESCARGPVGHASGKVAGFCNARTCTADSLASPPVSVLHTFAQTVLVGLGPTENLGIS